MIEYSYNAALFCHFSKKMLNKTPKSLNSAEFLHFLQKNVMKYLTPQHYKMITVETYLEVTHFSLIEKMLKHILK